MRDEREPVDEVIGAFVERLKAVPVSDSRARAAILARVRGRRPAPWRATLAMAWQPSVPMLAAATLVVAALGVGYASRVLVEPATTLASADSSVRPMAAAPVFAVSNTQAGVPRQFLLDHPGAVRVSLVGDFNGWDPTADVMTDPTGAGLWTATRLLPPGRHTYAYLVNDSIWTPDPRVDEHVTDDYGRANSVVMVSDR